MKNKLAKEFLTTKELEDLGIKSESSLRNDRWKGIGIPYVKIGSKSVRYRRADVLDYIERNRVVPEEF